MLWLAIAVGVHPLEASEVEQPIEGWLNSVVKLTTGPSLCAGVMLEEPGLVATAYHCVASGRRPKVETRQGEGGIGRTVAMDPENDLALVQIDGIDAWQGLPMRMDSPRVGEEVWALGHPFGFNADMVPGLEGLLYYSVSAGIVSGVGPNLVQVDAPLNPGNSGGPILDGEGRIVGIASRKLRGEGLSFVAPAEFVRELQDEIGEFRRIGGQYGLVLGLVTPFDIRSISISSAALGMRLALRDTLIVSGFGALGLGSNWEAVGRGEVSWVSWETSVALRGRVARGRWSTAVDAGPVLLGLDKKQAQIDDGHVTSFNVPMQVVGGLLLDLQFGGVGYGLRLVPDGNGGMAAYLVLSTALGGVMGTF